MMLPYTVDIRDIYRTLMGDFGSVGPDEPVRVFLWSKSNG